MRIVLDFNYLPEDLDEFGKLLWKARRKGSSVQRQHFIGWMIFIGIAVVFFMLLQKQTPTAPGPAPVVLAPATPAPPANPVYDLLLPLLPWIVLFAFIWFFVFRLLRRVGRRLYEANELLQLRHAMVIDEAEGISQNTAVTSASWKWPALTEVFEQARTFSIRVSRSQSFVIIPKLAVPPEQLDALRAMLNRCVRPATGAFPVVPIAAAATPPPLPPMDSAT